MLKTIYIYYGALHAAHILEVQLYILSFSVGTTEQVVTKNIEKNVYIYIPLHN